MANKTAMLWDRPTTPIVNVLMDNDDVSAVMDMHRGLADRCSRESLSLVALHKKLLGRQDCCWVGYYRYWVWDHSTWRVFVSNQRGVGFEVPEEAGLQEAREALQQYQEEMGIFATPKLKDTSVSFVFRGKVISECALCGGSPNVYVSKDPACGSQVSCVLCGARSFFRFKWRDAVALWNSGEILYTVCRDCGGYCLEDGCVDNNCLSSYRTKVQKL